MGWLKLLKNGALFVGLRNIKVGLLDQIGFVGHTYVDVTHQLCGIESLLDQDVMGQFIAN